MAIISVLFSVPQSTESGAMSPLPLVNQPVDEREFSTTTIRSKVEQTFGTSSPMVRVAFCESGYRQYKDGEVLRGVVNPKDVGLLQINEYYHLETSKRLGLNIHTIDGNLAYAKYLFDKNGTRDWNASKPCWNK